MEGRPFFAIHHDSLSIYTKTFAHQPSSEANVNLREAAFARIEDAMGISDPKILPSTYSKYDQRDTYLSGLEWGKLLLDDGLKHQHSTFKYANHHFELMNSSPYVLHDLMFVPTLELQCSDAQKKHWLPLAKSGNIIGAYCQTELGHGTFLRGLETTATLDMQTDEWVLDSPTISSTKFWPGGIGYSATHAIVIAKAVIRGQDHGPHPFVMQFRSVDDHKALPWIDLGDIGLKFGYNETDNGFARFDQVRIPREHMLMGNAESKKDGSYIKPQHRKLFYHTMTFGRMNIAYVVAFQLAQAVTIAIRYSVVREHGVGQEEAGHAQEYTIMSYKSQHARLLALMAQAFAIHFASKSVLPCTRTPSLVRAVEMRHSSPKITPPPPASRPTPRKSRWTGLKMHEDAVAVMVIRCYRAFPRFSQRCSRW